MKFHYELGDANVVIIQTPTHYQWELRVMDEANNMVVGKYSIFQRIRTFPTFTRCLLNVIQTLNALRYVDTQLAVTKGKFKKYLQDRWG